MSEENFNSEGRAADHLDALINAAQSGTGAPDETGITGFVEWSRSLRPDATYVDDLERHLMALHRVQRHARRRVIRRAVAVAAGGNVSDGGGKVAVSARVGADEAVAGSSEVGVLYSTEKMAVRVRSGVLVRNGVGGETRGRLQAASKTTAMSPTILRSFLNGNIHFSSISRQIITVLYYRTFNTCHSSQMRV